MKKFKFFFRKAIHHAVIVALLFMVMLPFYILIINSLKLPKDIIKDPFSFPGTDKAPMLLSGYGVAWKLVKGYIFNTVIVAVSEIFGVLLFASLAAYGFTCFRFRGRNQLFTFFLAFMMIPSILTLASQYALVYSGLKLGRTFAGVILPAVAGGMPVNIFLIRTFFNGVPGSLFEAAELDGASHFSRYIKIAVPLSMPILFTIGLSTLLGAWNDVIWSRLILYGNEKLYTISVGVFVSFNSTANRSITDTVIYAGYCIASLPLVIAFALTSRQFIKGLTNGAIKM
ncbi:MAG: carbohydrate ABC transporter permease [Clostridia bacterium]|nr:carbohydrate ABC transporter permease [Clostridia bacterium]